jgi:type IV pilus assembly protein PilB
MYHGRVAKRIGELLVEGGVLSQQQLEQALFAQRKDGRKLGQLLIELGLVGEVQLTQTLSRQLSVPWVSLYHVDFSRSLLNLVSRAAAEKYSLVPIFVRRVRNQGETLYVAMDDPTNDSALEEVARAGSLPVRPMIACPSDIRAAIRVYYLGETAPVPSIAAPQIVSVPSGSAPATTKGEPSAGPPLSGIGPSPGGLAAPAAPTAVAGPLLTVASDPPRAAYAANALSRVSPTPPSNGDGEGPTSSHDADGVDRDAAPKRIRPRMISLTLLDGTTIGVPSKRRPSKPDGVATQGEELSDQLTARDLVSALRAVAHGADASEILGAEPQWEAMFSALLSILLRKGLIADWEFVEEYRKV